MDRGLNRAEDRRGDGAKIEITRPEHGPVQAQVEIERKLLDELEEAAINLRDQLDVILDPQGQDKIKQVLPAAPPDPPVSQLARLLRDSNRKIHEVIEIIQDMTRRCQL